MNDWQILAMSPFLWVAIALYLDTKPKWLVRAWARAARRIERSRWGKR